MSEKGKSRFWVKAVGYPLFFLAVFVPSVFLTFPLNRVKARVLAEAEKHLKRKIDVDSIETTMLGGVAVKGLAVYGRGLSHDEPLITIPEVTARLGLLSLVTGEMEVTADAELFGGDVSCTYAKADKDQSVELEWSGLDLKKVRPLNEYLGVELKGTSEGKATLALEKGKLSKGNGELALRVSDAAILGGKVKGFKLPPIKLGDLDWKASVEKGRVTLKGIKAESDDLSFQAEGSITLSERIQNSRLNLKTTFGFSEKFLSKNKAIKGGLSLIKRAMGKDKKYGYRITGSLRHPIPRPWRR